ncbi:MAG: tRNA (adenosine(37)-N6)-threonylcarbamoyltransferase complex ATPase subunit type 1 TsaE, partial [Synergistaceae bacterium]|nr:tRNA (adenosine(37)-N6)-threonylcarbamoyltransferase complex ATPase subunit type 1 TsaE [Synergistaceae bacterium]
MNKNNLIERNTIIANSFVWNKVIAVTGALGSGKTEFTISLARALANN